MKKKLFLFALLLVGLTGCTNDEGTNSGTEPVVMDPFQAKIVGTWVFSAVSALDTDMTSSATTALPCLTEVTITLNQDSSFVYYNACTSDSTLGVYTYADPIFTLTADGKSQEFTYSDEKITTVMSVDASQLGIALPLPELEATFTFTKKQ